VGLVFEAIVTGTYRILTSDGDRVAVAQMQDSSASPSDWDWIAADVPENSIRKYANGIMALVTWEAGQFLSEAGRHQYGASWEWVYSRIYSPIQSTPAPGGSSVDLFAHVWRFIPLEPAEAPSAPLPATPTEVQVQQALGKHAATDHLTSDATAKLLNKMVADEYARDPTGLPDPSIVPVTPADIVAVPTPAQFTGTLIIPTEGQDPASLPDGGGDPSPGGDPTTGGTTSINWGQFSPPALPSLPDPADFFHGWLDPMKALAPLVPDHSSVCPTVRFTWFGGQSQIYDRHCALADGIRPTLRLGASIAAGLGAFWTVVGA